MRSEPQELREYVTVRGKNPFRQWIRSLRSQRDAGRIRVRLNRLRLGNFGDAKSLGDGIHELRLHFGPGYRIYFGRDGKTVVLLLHGGSKGSQAKDIERARRYWIDYRERSS